MPFARMGVTLDSIVLDKTDLMDIFLLNTFDFTGTCCDYFSHDCFSFSLSTNFPISYFIYDISLVTFRRLTLSPQKPESQSSQTPCLSAYLGHSPVFPIRKFRLFLKTMSLRLFRKRLSDRPAQVFIGTAAAQNGL